MAEQPTTSTMVLHHDRCKPAEWTPKDVLALAKFVGTGRLQEAAAISRRLGMQLVVDERHSAKGGTLERLGVASVQADGDGYVFQYVNDLHSEVDDADIFELREIHAGPVRYAVAIGIGDEDGGLEGYEYEFFDTHGEARKYLDGIRTAA